jgi:hypothetical protein
MKSEMPGIPQTIFQSPLLILDLLVRALIFMTHELSLRFQGVPAKQSNVFEIALDCSL